MHSAKMYIQQDLNSFANLSKSRWMFAFDAILLAWTCKHREYGECALMKRYGISYLTILLIHKAQYANAAKLNMGT